MSISKEDDKEQSIRRKIEELRSQYPQIAELAEQKVSKANLESTKIDLKTKSEIRKLMIKY